MKALKLSQTVNYCKGWYKRGDLVEDLKVTLLADGYTTYNKDDVMLVLLSNLERAEHWRVSAFDILNAIRIEHSFGLKDYKTLVIEYLVGILFNLEKKKWEYKEPDYSILLSSKEKNTLTTS